MHAKFPGGLCDHPPSTSSTVLRVVAKALGVAEDQQGEPGAGSLDQQQ